MSHWNEELSRTSEVLPRIFMNLRYLPSHEVRQEHHLLYDIQWYRPDSIRQGHISWLTTFSEFAPPGSSETKSPLFERTCQVQCYSGTTRVPGRLYELLSRVAQWVLFLRFSWGTDPAPADQMITIDKLFLTLSAYTFVLTLLLWLLLVEAAVAFERPSVNVLVCEVRHRHPMLVLHGGPRPDVCSYLFLAAIIDQLNLIPSMLCNTYRLDRGVL